MAQQVITVTQINEYIKRVMDGDQLCYRIDAAPKLQRIPEAELPQTGQRNLPVWGLLGGGLALIAAGIELQKRK